MRVTTRVTNGHANQVNHAGTSRQIFQVSSFHLIAAALTGKEFAALAVAQTFAFSGASIKKKTREKEPKGGLEPTSA